MTILDAWNTCKHGGRISRPSGVFIDKWMGEKPELKPSFDRWLDENINIIPAADIVAGDWIVNT